MSSFLYRLGQRSARHPFRVIGMWLVVAIAVLGLHTQLGGEMKDNFTAPGTEAQRADDLLTDRFTALSAASGQIVFHAEQGAITDPQNEAAVDAALAQLADGTDVTAVTDPFDARGPTVSADGTTAYATVYYAVDPLEAEHTDQATEAADIARDRGVQAELTGTLVAQEIEGNEAVGLAVAVIVLLIAFGSLIAMAIPIVTALIGLIIGLGGVGIMAYFVDTPVTSTTIASMIGLGVGIDYALFVVTRHRQHASPTPPPVSPCCSPA
jgi:RND superfamily putative drug exporter